MKTIIRKVKVKKVEKHDDYQEIFYVEFLTSYLKSIKIYSFKKDIAAMLKKSFWGRCKSVLEIHSLCSFPIKVYLDGELLLNLDAENYPKKLKQLINEENEFNQNLRKQFEAFLPNYPKKDNLEAEVFALNSILFRAYAGAVLEKLTALGKISDDLCQRRCSLLFDLLKFLDGNKEYFSVYSIWPPRLNGEGLIWLCYPENFPQMLAQKLGLEKLSGFDNQIRVYLAYWIGEANRRFCSDGSNLFSFLCEQTGLFSARQVDRQLIIQYNKPLEICQPWDGVPNFLVDEPISTPELKCYLSKQNW